MKRIIPLIISLVAFTTLSIASADAQLGIIPQVRVKAGLFFPSSTGLTNAIGSAWLKVGADVSLPVGFNIPIVGASTRLGIDYAMKGSSSLVPITLTEVIQPSAGVKSPIYGGLGIGLYTAHFKGAGSASRFGYRLLGGFQFTSKFFVEAQYDVVGQIRGTRADGVSVLVGTHF